MKTELKLALERAINKVIADNCEKDLWDGYIHNDLEKQMANAAEQVFDSSMSGQQYAKDQI